MSAVIIPREEQVAPWSISHHSPLPIDRPEVGFDFAKPGDLIREVHYFYYFHDPILSWDPAVIREIKSFDPDALPCFVKKVYRWPTGGEAVLNYFAILRSRYPTTLPKEPFTFKHCSCSKHHGVWPNIEELVFGDTPPREGWPESFIPCDARLAQRMKHAFWASQRSIKEQARDYIEGEEQKREKAERAMREESDYRWDHEWSYLKRQAEQISGPELANLNAPRHLPTPKPFVHLQQPSSKETH